MSAPRAMSKAEEDTRDMPPPPLPPQKDPAPSPSSVPLPVSNAQQAELDFTIPLMYEQDPHHLVAISVLSLDPCPVDLNGIAQHRVERDGRIKDTETVQDFLQGEFDSVCRIKLNFDCFNSFDEFGTKEQIDRGLAAIMPVVDRAEFCIKVQFHDDALDEEGEAQEIQRSGGYELVKQRLMGMVKSRWAEVGWKLAGNGDAKVRLDLGAVWGYGKRMEIISWLPSPSKSN